MPKRKATTEERWVKQWKVPSESNPAKSYTVSVDKDGNYACHCWPFLRSRVTCKHIEAVHGGAYPAINETLAPEPQIVLYNVQQVEPEYDEDGKTVKACKTPLVPVGEMHFLATLIFDLNHCGVRWPTLTERYHLDRSWTPGSVESYLREQGGRKIYGDWHEWEGPDGKTRGEFKGFKIVPMS